MCDILYSRNKAYIYLRYLVTYSQDAYKDL